MTNRSWEIKNLRRLGLKMKTQMIMRGVHLSPKTLCKNSLKLTGHRPARGRGEIFKTAVWCSIPTLTIHRLGCSFPNHKEVLGLHAREDNSTVPAWTSRETCKIIELLSILLDRKHNKTIIDMLKWIIEKEMSSMSGLHLVVAPMREMQARVSLG